MNFIKHTITLIAGIAIIMAPIAGINAESTADSSLNASVQSIPAQITINVITAVKTSGIADGTFENGWKWIFDITLPINEQNLMMRFDNWFMASGGFTIPAVGNIRFYSSQSSNAFSQQTAIHITAPSTYSSSAFLIGNIGAPAGFRRVQVTVEARIPGGSQSGVYTTNFGIRSIQ